MLTVRNKLNFWLRPW